MARTRNKKIKKYNILVCAHPDDETLFFAGLVLQSRKQNWLIACVTDGNADGMGQKRKADFEKACRLLGAQKTEFFGLPDVYDQRLDIKRLQMCLSQLPPAQIVYTHGPVGEYGHPHHQDVCFAVHDYFQKKTKVRGVAYNCEPDFVIQLSPAEFKTKAKILSTIYGSETQRFQNLLPCTFAEGFTEYSMAEVSELYRFYSEKKWPDGKKLKKTKWLLPFFEIHKNNPVGPRPF